jgi:hypothetical protein
MSGPVYEYRLVDGDRKCIILSPWDDTSAIDLRVKAEQMGILLSSGTFTTSMADVFVPQRPLRQAMRQRPDPPIVPFDMEIAGMKIKVSK